MTIATSILLRVDEAPAHGASENSRRSVMNMIASISTFSSISGAAMADSTSLASLSQKFEPIYAEYLEVRSQYDQKWEETENLMRQRGIHPGHRPEYWDRKEQVWIETGFAAIAVRNEELLEDLGALQEEILRVPAKTIEDLAVKARAAALTDIGLWDEEPDDLDWDKRWYREMIEQACKAGGYPEPMKPVESRQSATLQS